MPHTFWWQVDTNLADLTPNMTGQRSQTDAGGPQNISKKWNSGTHEGFRLVEQEDGLAELNPHLCRVAAGSSWGVGGSFTLCLYSFKSFHLVTVVV